MEYQYSESGAPSSHHQIRDAASCHACGSRIGTRERQLTWRIRDGADVFTYHYCSDVCLPETAPETP